MINKNLNYSIQIKKQKKTGTIGVRLNIEQELNLMRAK